MEKRWEFPARLTPEQLQHKASLAAFYKCPDLIAELLVRKGYLTPQQTQAYFNSGLESLPDPYLFKNMRLAVDRILTALNRKEKITIYGDYDVDGTTSTALLYLGLKKVGAMVDFYIPHRMIDGYGISREGVESLQKKGTQLIISVDFGMSGIDEVDQINALGMEIIITDHHNPKEILPKALAIINPKLEDSGYPDRNLAGVGVAYKLLMAVYTALGITDDESRIKYMDLVAMGTIADIVPLVGENRVFARLGLERLALRRNKGLNALIEISGLQQKLVTATDIVFGLAPRINAAGRMGSAARAVELLISVDETESLELAEIIERENSLRQQHDSATFEEACEIIEKKYKNMAETYCLVVSSHNWHPGVIGIVSSKLVERYYRPTFMVTFAEGAAGDSSSINLGSGSGRSIPGFDLFAALTTQKDLLDSYGGHKYATGLSIMSEYLDRFENNLQKYARSMIKPEELQPVLELDHQLELYEINDDLMLWQDKFAPFGSVNQRPTFFTLGVSVDRYPYTVGRNHLKLKVKKDGRYLDLIGFNLGHFLPQIKKDTLLDIAYSLELNVWQGKTAIQGKLKDIRLSH